MAELNKENQEWLNCACVDTHESETERWVFERPVTENKLLEMQLHIERLEQENKLLKQQISDLNEYWQGRQER